MIKIQINDVLALKTSYLRLIKPLVLDKLKFLKLSLEHLQDHTKIVDKDIVSVKSYTKDIANIIRPTKVAKGYFNKPVYIYGVQHYLDGINNINTVNLNDLTNLINTLLDPTKNELDLILIGDPENLKDTSDNLLAQYNLVNAGELDVLKLAFDYKGEIGSIVRHFFYDRNLTTFCPYCNQGIALHTENANTGKTADQFNLDHFFDKDNNPLLALSVFNLVPCDTTCNLTNKYTTPFSDKFHLNPYISGFKRDMVFKPVYDIISDEITEIELKITVDRNSARHLQLIGDKDKLDEQPEHGNLNVFQIYTKYNRDDVLKKSGRILRNMRRTAINIDSLKSILGEIGMVDSYENFKKWYEEHIYTEFHEKEFDKQAYSKLNRDMLDFVYEAYSDSIYNEVRKIISNSYLPTKGGE
ncbi:MAG: hypothetical protein Q8861_00380 [Bacteroidota bacterium]|nr:hypothetical protein [Bacteroidota bacterium]MDP4268535.1 hypothetical protein [Bacteroidota bacterium]